MTKRIILLSVLLWNMTILAAQNPDEPVSKEELLREIEQKMIRIQAFLQKQDLDGILLSRVNNFAWITAGLGDNHILLSSETGVASLLILKSGKKYILANTTELPHLLEEEVSGLGYEPRGWGWWENQSAAGQVKQLVSDSRRIGTDTPQGDLRYLEPEFSAVRLPLTDSELKKYRWVCRQSAEAVVTVCRQIKPGMTDREIETMTSAELQRRGLRPTVILIGVDERLQKYYHYPAVGKTLQKHAFVNVCARRWGLTSSVGRYVHFGPVPAEIENNMKKSARISAQLEAATIAGAKASDLFRKGQQWYAQAGFPDGWKAIHFGGGIGYAEREWVAAPASTEVIRPRTAYAWNPFTPAALSFDTIFLHEDGATEKLTGVAGFPVIPVEVNGKTYQMPGILVR